ncbi:MAG: MFS transporter [Myxococcales bacterium]|jgi:Na+/melibiose symporter-like transporter
MVDDDKLRLGTKLWYGFGQVSEGIKNFAFQLYLLYFYNQVMGVSAALVGTALLVALIFDAVTDPMVASLSDSLKSRFGRRHGFMYAAAVPMGVAFYFTFSPPAGLSENGLLAWAFVWAVLSRAAMTLYHVPHLALGAELSPHYHQRTTVVAFRVFFGYLGAALLVVLSRAVFLPATEQYPVGQDNPAGYPVMGMAMGVLMAVAIFASALGTHERIPHLPKAGASAPPFSVRRLLGEMVQALGNRSFRAFFTGLLLFTIGRGVDLALWLYVGKYFFMLGDSTQLVPLMSLIGVIVGTPLWPLFKLEKRSMFIWGITGYAVLTMGLPIAKLIGFFPAEGSALYVPLIFTTAFTASAFGAAPVLAAGSMIADISDEHELVTGRRQEGIFFGALSFSLKAAAGVGNWLGAMALSAIAFPTQVKDPTAVDPWVVSKLALIYGPAVLLVVIWGIAVMRGYRLSSARHAEIRRELAERRKAAPADVPPQAAEAAELAAAPPA